MKLNVDQYFDLASSLESGQAHRWQRQGQWYSGVIYSNLVHIQQTPFGVEFFCTPTTEAELVHILASYFRLDDDLPAIYREIGHDPKVAQMVSQYRGLRLLRQEPWECLIAFILSANCNITRIAANMEKLAEHFGKQLTLGGDTRYTFPSPIKLSTASEKMLRGLGLGFRAKYVASATEAVTNGRLDLELLKHMPYDEAKASLMELQGIGPKIADCVMAFALDKMEAFPIDVWVRRALTEWYFPDGKPPPDWALLKWAQTHFGMYSAYAQQYLFHGRRLSTRK